MTTCFRRVRLFVQAMVRAARQKLSGRPILASSKLYDARLAVCHVCPFYNASFGSCTLCGCNTQLKAVLLTETCPADKWQFPDITF